MEKEDIQKIGSKLIVLMDYTATQEDELNIQFAETVFADVLRQGGADRIWAYCPRTDQCGFVPVSLVIPPVVWISLIDRLDKLASKAHLFVAVRDLP